MITQQHYNTNQLQAELFIAAKSGNITTMRHLIIEGADPFAMDANDVTPISYAMESDPVKTGAMLMDLAHITQNQSSLRKSKATAAVHKNSSQTDTPVGLPRCARNDRGDSRNGGSNAV
ncbi:hypothetical protein N9N97_01555 [Rickettsiaceae bacterium]|nr:hypothetical protein [Rickettsiaceae bacterium]